MAVVPSSPIAPGGFEFAGHARRRIALRLLPFLFILYITNYLDRTSVAYAALGMWGGIAIGLAVLLAGVAVGSLAFERRGGRLMEFAESS